MGDVVEDLVVLRNVIEQGGVILFVISVYAHCTEKTPADLFISEEVSKTATVDKNSSVKIICGFAKVAQQRL
ncbi:hypothetical protein DGG96_07395 [Legionella qingyii]|uniref:Uncharacterized protein n=1 Tax=Legionella qingyii TaxID=2184757 RepID=A0A317U3M2_9GAMM|nr:hypothetical protein [Legionella qingyii]PWY56311.1 hypothetical protein DGG96_07395 [Legionella qingyii]